MARNPCSQVVTCHALEDGTFTLEVIEKGTLVQEVDMQVDHMINRWKILERNYSHNTTWMVRNDWRQWPILVFWRVSACCDLFGRAWRIALSTLFHPIRLKKRVYIIKHQLEKAKGSDLDVS